MKEDPVRFAPIVLSVGAILAACASAAAGTVVSGSVAGLAPQSVVSAASDVCAERGGTVIPGNRRSVRCHINGRKIAFALSGSEPALTLDVMSLDAKTAETDLKKLRDSVLGVLSR